MPPVVLIATLALVLAIAACSGQSGQASPTSQAERAGRPATASPAVPSASASGSPRQPAIRSGLGWASGANGNHPADVNAWASWTGRPVDVAVVFTTRNDWPSLTTASWPVGAFTRAQFPGQLSVAQPLYPVSGNELACARGDYDGSWAQFGSTLTRYGRGDAYVRLGWEFNGAWMYWHVRDPQAWKSCFVHAVTAIRSTAPRVRIEWTLSAHSDTLPGGDTDVWAAYPGDAYVDVVSIDDYDIYPASTTQNAWDQQCHQPSGLCTVADFARAHHKKLAVPEWGLSYSNGGGGDNPFYIEKMHDFFTRNTGLLAYEAYFNTSEAGNVRSSLHNPDLNPDSSHRYLDLFGTSRGAGG
ncbi:GH26 domain-containing protein [Frankia sp. AiPs1]|uniref:glycoside hydrolase family 26 protein n=1 Tax=Frankia sp. AiPa1 TaxID=573492 RepID=UPI00202B71FB|nr:glycosyl hydrolase [Frankia sp. AiPa1]MCL9760470.1 glycosidase [Frankia sp. AiPa1]